MYQRRKYNKVVVNVEEENEWRKSATEEVTMRKIVEKWNQVRMLNEEQKILNPRNAMSFFADYVLARYGYAGSRQRNFNIILKKAWLVISIFLIFWLFKY